MLRAWQIGHFFAVFSLVGTATILSAQDALPKGMSQSLHICNLIEGTTICGDVFWNGHSWKGQNDLGSRADVTMTRYEVGALKFTVSDGKGATAEYDGTIDSSGRGKGKAVIKTEGKKQVAEWVSLPAQLTDISEIGTSPPFKMPTAFDVCNVVLGKQDCWKASWDGRRFVPRSPTAGAFGTVSIQSFNLGEIKFSLLAAGGSVNATYVGNLNRNRPSGGTLAGKSKTGPFEGTWTSAPEADSATQVYATASPSTPTGSENTKVHQPVQHDSQHVVPTVSTLSGKLSELPNLSGRWEAELVNGSARTKVAFAVSQVGDQVTVTIKQPNVQEVVVYEGTFRSNERIEGQARGPSASLEHPNWVPETITLNSPSRLQFSSGLELVLVEKSNIGAVAVPVAKKPAPYLPETPFDLNGIWVSEMNMGPFSKVKVTQVSGTVSIAYAFGGDPFFNAQYIKNPTLIGKGQSRFGDYRNPTWVEKSIFVEDPDHIRLNGEDKSFGFYRLTSPIPHDLTCREENPYHVKDYYAWVRGQTSAHDNDQQAARCWMSIAANQGYAPAQSVLAAILIAPGDGRQPDYEKAFLMARKSAEQNDISGALILAGLYREGKGTPSNDSEARYWAQRAKDLSLTAKLRLWTDKSFLGLLSPLDVAQASYGAFKAMDDENLNTVRNIQCINNTGVSCPSQ